MTISLWHSKSSVPYKQTSPEQWLTHDSFLLWALKFPTHWSLMVKRCYVNKKTHVAGYSEVLKIQVYLSTNPHRSTKISNAYNDLTI